MKLSWMLNQQEIASQGSGPNHLHEWIVSNLAQVACVSQRVQLNWTLHEGLAKTQLRGKKEDKCPYLIKSFN